MRLANRLMNEEQLRQLLEQAASLRDEADMMHEGANHLESAATDIESIVRKAAEVLGLDPYEVKEF